ncbi:PepSY domain-containing protein [Arthrobacter crystallopoietes]|uniref:PepSY domain-containing protein n=1 Tax=Crystallibacter crystallopoietes TaxID=37928 RepID=UPI001ABE27AC|nr:PepSY domain-containing protein [Arthrobacter crystallopoietes]QTG79522.1 hypothetical protein J5251_11245 [Arthrobacter crystallopoietes]
MEGVTVPMAGAMTTELDEVSGSVEEASLDDKIDMPVWDIEIEAAEGSSTEVVIDAAGGERMGEESISKHVCRES